MKIYTDGSCIKKHNKDSTGASGWAFAILEKDFTLCNSGGEKDSTNNRMELQAVIEALKMDYKEYEIYSDSKLVVNCAQKLWKRNKNLDMWLIYDEISKNKVIKFIWVKGHSGNFYNDLVDKLAGEEARKLICIS